MSKIVWLVIGFVALLMFLWLLIVNAGLKQTEVVECLQWQKQTDTLPNFWVVRWQVDQCNALGMPLDGVNVR